MDDARSTAPTRSTIDDMKTATRLTAYVVRPGPDPALHGYAVESDLALHYTTAEVTLLALTGEIPLPEQGRAFEVVTIFVAPIPVTEAPSHAATLAARCDARNSGVLSTAAIALAEQARTIVSDHAELLAWLESPEGEPADQFLAQTDEERAAVERLRHALRHREAADPSPLEHPLNPWAAALAVLYGCGLREPRKLELAVAAARWPIAAAEAFAVKGGDLRGYPIGLPHFHYQHARTTGE